MVRLKKPKKTPFGINVPDNKTPDEILMKDSMSSKTGETTARQHLRQEAEERFAQRPAIPHDENGYTPEQILHELQVHQIELEMQNEALRDAQQTLEESRDKFADLYDFAPVGYLTLTKSATIEEGNLTCATILGVERKKLIKSRFAKFIVSDDAERWNQYFIRVLRTTDEQVCELKLRKADGSTIIARLESIRQQQESLGPVIRMAVSDITDRVRAEENLALKSHDLDELNAAYRTIADGQEKLQTALQRLYLILSGMNFGILLVTDDDRVEFANQVFCDIFGLKDSPADLSGLSASAMIEKIRPAYIDPDAVVARIGEIIRQGEPVKGEDVGMRSGRTYLRDFTPIRLGGKQYGRLWTHIDITDRKKAEENLRFQANLLANISDVVYATDLEMRVTSWNHAAEEMYGWKEEEVLGKSVFEFTGSKFDPAIRARLTRELLEKGSVTAQVEHMTKADNRVIFDSVTLVLRDAGGNVNGFLGVNRDITWRILAEEELKRKNEDLNKTIAEKDILLSEIHHRVKNNLTAFISLLSLEGSIEDTPAGKTLKMDLQNRARSMALIHETLYRTKMYNEVDMGKYMTNLLDHIAVSFRLKRSVKIVVEAEGVLLDIPRATPAGLIINELVTNVFKYAFPESFDAPAVRGTPPTITVALSKVKGMYEMTVKDNGIGLPPEIDLSKTQTLGLKLVNFLARHQMRAKVEVNSTAGTEFIFRFRE